MTNTLLFAFTALDELERQHGESGCTRAIREGLKEAAGLEAVSDAASALARNAKQISHPKRPTTVLEVDVDRLIAATEALDAARDAAKERT